MEHNFQASRQWERIQNRWITEDAGADLTQLKSDSRNFKLSLWDPSTNGVRYLKTLAYNLGMALTPPQELARISRTPPNREVGGPTTVRCQGETLCLDYLQATFEVGFIESEIDLDGARVLEIGAGYGRTCHMIMSNHDLSGYCIVDLKNTLELSRAYLREVLDEPPLQADRFHRGREPDGHLPALGAFRPVHQHPLDDRDGSGDGPVLSRPDRRDVLGLLREEPGRQVHRQEPGRLSAGRGGRTDGAGERAPCDSCWTSTTARRCRPRSPAFVDGYRPGSAWTCVGDGRALPWSYLWQALYKNPRR